MKAIIVEEKEFAEICELMRYKVEELANKHVPEGIERSIWLRACGEAHRSMHFHFVKWAQGQGASCVS